MPTDEEVAKWLVSVRIERGATKALMCELVLASGMRREEVVQWRVDTLPEDRGDWQVIGDQVEVLIKYGTKGAKQPGPAGLEAIAQQYHECQLGLATVRSQLQAVTVERDALRTQLTKRGVLRVLQDKAKG